MNKVFKRPFFSSARKMFVNMGPNGKPTSFPSMRLYIKFKIHIHDAFQ